uniref:Uncharacterized protein n=1 Tax=Caenorhabditis japonica TaxID=281687 RepID=A0A8R1EN27_CAEJA
MVSDIDRATILRLSESGQTQKSTGFSRRTIENTMRRFRKTGTTNMRSIPDKIRYNPKRSLRKVAKELHISATSVRNIIKHHMGLRPITH